MVKTKIISSRFFRVIALLLIVFAVVLLTLAFATPANRGKMERYFQRDEKHLKIVANYLENLDYLFIRIDKSNMKDGVMFTGANTRYQEIKDETVLKSLKVLLSVKGYIVIGKNQNTVFFRKWQFLGKDRGIALAFEKEKLTVEFLVKTEPLSENGWYYYEADYEEYRQKKQIL